LRSRRGQRLGDRLEDREAGVERRERILEDDLRLAPERHQLLARELEHRAAVEGDRPRGRRDEPKQAARHGRLPRAALTHEADRLVLADLEVDAVDGVHAPGRRATAPAGATRQRDAGMAEHLRQPDSPDERR
jgi:hypothetical protein